MIRIMQRLYHSIHLNLGIKRIIEQASRKGKLFVDTDILFPLSQKLQRYLYREVIDHYGADYGWSDERSQNLDRSTDNYGYGLLQYAMIRNLRPKRVLCVGSMYGFIPYMLTKACMENRVGHVDFVDAAYDYHDKKFARSHYFGQGFWKKVRPRTHFSYLLDNAYISTYIMTLKQYMDTHARPYDYVYLDGDHSYNGLVRDIRLVWPKLTDGGLLCLHDIEFDFQKSLAGIDAGFRKEVEQITFGVQQIWKQMGGMKYALPILNNYSGIGFVQKTRVPKRALPAFLR